MSATRPPLDALRAVPCPLCQAPAGQPCTSHGGTRVRRTDVHIVRTRAFLEAQAKQHAEAVADVAYLEAEALNSQPALDHLAELYTEAGHPDHLARQFAAELLAKHTRELTAMQRQHLANQGYDTTCVCGGCSACLARDYIDVLDQYGNRLLRTEAGR